VSCKHARHRHSHSVKYRRGWQRVINQEDISNSDHKYLNRTALLGHEAEEHYHSLDNVTTLWAENGEDLVDYIKNKYSEGKVSKEFVWSAARYSIAFMLEFRWMRVKWCNIMPTIVMLVTCALKRRKDTRTKRNIFNGAFNDFWDAIFTFIDKLEYILYFSKKHPSFSRFVGSRHALLLQSYYFRTLLAMCFTHISFHLRRQNYQDKVLLASHLTR